MKCDELKDYDYDPDFPFQSRGRFYVADDVEAAIAELKAENERLNRQLEHVKNGDCIYTCDVVEKHVKEELKAKRALWLARAERAAAWQVHWALCHNHSIERDFSIIGTAVPDDKHTTMKTPREWSIIWKRIYNKCRDKAEEYK